MVSDDIEHKMHLWPVWHFCIVCQDQKSMPPRNTLIETCKGWAHGAAWLQKHDEAQKHCLSHEQRAFPRMKLMQTVSNVSNL